MLHKPEINAPGAEIEAHNCESVTNEPQRRAGGFLSIGFPSCSILAGQFKR